MQPSSLTPQDPYHHPSNTPKQGTSPGFTHPFPQLCKIFSENLSLGNSPRPEGHLQEGRSRPGHLISQTTSPYLLDQITLSPYISIQKIPCAAPSRPSSSTPPSCPRCPLTCPSGPGEGRRRIFLSQGMGGARCCWEVVLSQPLGVLSHCGVRKGSEEEGAVHLHQEWWWCKYPGLKTQLKTNS